MFKINQVNKGLVIQTHSSHSSFDQASKSLNKLSKANPANEYKLMHADDQTYFDHKTLTWVNDN